MVIQVQVCSGMTNLCDQGLNSDLQNFAYKSGLIEQHQFAYSKFSSTTVVLLKVVDS